MTRLVVKVGGAVANRSADALLELVRRSFAAVNDALCAAIGERAVPLFGDRIGLEAAQVPELGLGGEVVDRIDVAAAEELMASGTLEGGIIPKLGAAIAAARRGVPAFIGQTEVPAQ